MDREDEDQGEPGHDEPGSDEIDGHDEIHPVYVLDEATRAFERRDAHVPAGPGRGPTPDEERAAELAPPLYERTRQAYKEMVWRGITQQGAGRIP